MYRLKWRSQTITLTLQNSGGDDTRFHRIHSSFSLNRISSLSVIKENLQNLVPKCGEETGSVGWLRLAVVSGEMRSQIGWNEKEFWTVNL